MTQPDSSGASLSTLVKGLVAFLDERQKHPRPVPVRSVPEDLVRAFGSFASHLVILMLVARSDDDVAESERQVILRYCADRAQRLGTPLSAPEEDALDDYLRKFHPSLTEIISAIEGLRQASAADIAGLIKIGRAHV